MRIAAHFKLPLREVVAIAAGLTPLDEGANLRKIKMRREEVDDPDADGDAPGAGGSANGDGGGGDSPSDNVATAISIVQAAVRLVSAVEGSNAYIIQAGRPKCVHIRDTRTWLCEDTFQKAQ